MDWVIRIVSKITNFLSVNYMETEAQVGCENCQGYINCPIVESRFKSVFSDLGGPVLNHHYCYSWFIF